MDEVPPLLPAVRREPLLRGPLILTAVSRVLLVPFYLICGIGSSKEFGFFFGRFAKYYPLYLADKFAMVGMMWSFLLLSMLLVWLFFSRRRMFRPLMIYFSLLVLVLIVCVGIHTHHFPPRHRLHSDPDPHTVWIGSVVLVSVVLWPFYYAFSPRVKRVFTR